VHFFARARALFYSPCPPMLSISLRAKRALNFRGGVDGTQTKLDGVVLVGNVRASGTFH